MTSASQDQRILAVRERICLVVERERNVQHREMNFKELSGGQKRIGFRSRRTSVAKSITIRGKVQNKVR